MKHFKIKTSTVLVRPITSPKLIGYFPCYKSSYISVTKKSKDESDGKARYARYWLCMIDNKKPAHQHAGYSRNSDLDEGFA